MGGLSGSEVVLRGEIRQGWWVVVDREEEPAQVVAGPFPDRTEAGWVAETCGDAGARAQYGTRRADGAFLRRPSPQDWAWLAHLGGQLDQLPGDWDAGLADDDPLVTLVVEIAAALSEAGLPIRDADGAGARLGGACLAPETGLGGVVVTWHQHDRMSVDRVHGGDAAAAVQQVMGDALAQLLAQRGFAVEPFGGAGGSLVRAVA